MYRFDQLFEKLPNGSYRERPKPVPRLSIDHRHDYFWSPTTGRLCVLYPAQRLEWWNFKNMETEQKTRVATTNEEVAALMMQMDTGQESVGLLGGNWLYGPRINWSFGLQSPEAVGAGWGDVMMQAAGCAIGDEQQSSSGGTNGGTTEPPTS